MYVPGWILVVALLAVVLALVVSIHASVRAAALRRVVGEMIDALAREYERKPGTLDEACRNLFALGILGRRLAEWSERHHDLSTLQKNIVEMASKHQPPALENKRST
jgi:biopolymer transport protein ExbB/TolQ